MTDVVLSFGVCTLLFVEGFRIFVFRVSPGFFACYSFGPDSFHLCFEEGVYRLIIEILWVLLY